MGLDGIRAPPEDVYTVRSEVVLASMVQHPEHDAFAKHASPQVFAMRQGRAPCVLQRVRPDV